MRAGILLATKVLPRHSIRINRLKIGSWFFLIGLYQAFQYAEALAIMALQAARVKNALLATHLPHSTLPGGPKRQSSCLTASFKFSYPRFT